MEHISCERARTLFDEKLDGVIRESENELLEAHLARCETCRREYKMLEKTHAYLGTLAVEIPSELSARVMESIGKEPKRRASILSRLRPLVAIPVAALLCVALLHSPLLDGMFAAKEVADMAEGINKADGDLSSALNNMNNKPMYDGALEDATPEEIAPSYASHAITDTSLTLRFTDEKNAVLLCEKNGTSKTVTYSKNQNVITIEKDGKKASFVLTDNALTPTDKDALDALLSE